MQFTRYGGGFSAAGANRTVNLGNLRTLTWGSGDFLPDDGTLALGTSTADATIDFQNPMNLGSGMQTVLVTAGRGAAAVDARLSGVLSGSGGLTIAGGGKVLLSGEENTYRGGTVVDSGTLIIASRGPALPDGSRLSVGSGGELVFNASLAAAPGEAWRQGRFPDRRRWRC